MLAIPLSFGLGQILVVILHFGVVMDFTLLKAQLPQLHLNSNSIYF